MKATLMRSHRLLTLANPVLLEAHFKSSEGYGLPKSEQQELLITLLNRRNLKPLVSGPCEEVRDLIDFSK